MYRVGGDEFVVISEGEDFEKRYELLAELNRVAEENVKKKDAVVAAGLSDFVADTDQNLRMIFERTDLLMYQRKKELKELEKRIPKLDESNNA